MKALEPAKAIRRWAICSRFGDFVGHNKRIRLWNSSLNASWQILNCCLYWFSQCFKNTKTVQIKKTYELNWCATKKTRIIKKLAIELCEHSATKNKSTCIRKIHEFKRPCIINESSECRRLDFCCCWFGVFGVVVGFERLKCSYKKVYLERIKNYKNETLFFCLKRLKDTQSIVIIAKMGDKNRPNNVHLNDKDWGFSRSSMYVKFK